jgi:hypothetical protein
MMASGYLPDTGPGWSVVGTDDYDNDGKADIMWHNDQTGQNVSWLMDGLGLRETGPWLVYSGDFWRLGAV